MNIDLNLIKEAEKLQTKASLKISDALQPLNPVMAPFYIMILQGYAEMMEELYPGATKMAEALKAGVDTIKIVRDLEKENGPTGGRR